MELGLRPRVLVTGATGLIGRHLVAQLIETGAVVRILTRAETRVPSTWAALVETEVGDVTDPRAVDRAVADIDVVHHLAGELYRAERFYATNVEGTRRVLEACHAHGVPRLVHYSSVGVIGPVRGRVDESAACRPANSYERSKLAGESVAHDLGKEWGIAVTILRPTNVFGEGRAGSMLQWFLAIQRGWFRRIGPGAVANYIYAGDVAHAGRALARQHDAAGRVFIVSDPIPMDAFVDMIAEAMGVSIPPGRIPVVVAMTAAAFAEVAAHIVDGALAAFTRSRVRALVSRALYSSDRLQGLGIRPAVGVREGLRRTVAWYRAQGCLD